MTKAQKFVVSIIAIIVLMCMFSCVTEKQRMKICRNCPVKDSTITVEKTIVKDTTIYVTQTVTEPIYIDNPCANLCDSLGNLKPFFKSEKKNGIVKTITTQNNQLKFDCKADSLEVVLKGLITERNKRSETHSTKTVEVFQTTKWQGFLIVSAYGFWGLLIAYLLYRAIKLWLKTYKPF